jgi:hypothetical protein
VAGVIPQARDCPEPNFFVRRRCKTKLIHIHDQLLTRVARLHSYLLQDCHHPYHPMYGSYASTASCSLVSFAYTRTCCKTAIIRITLCPARTHPRPTAHLCRSPTQVPVARLPSSASPAYHSPTSLAYTRSCCKIAIIRIILCTARTRPRPTAHSCRSPTLVPIARLPSSASPAYRSPASLLGIVEDHDPPRCCLSPRSDLQCPRKGGAFCVVVTDGSGVTPGSDSGRAADTNGAGE